MPYCMPRRKKGLSLEEHQLLGFKLKLLREELADIYFQLQDAYGKSSNTCKQLDSARAKVDAVRCELDNLVCAENPSVNDQIVINCYYGTAREEFVTANNPQLQFLLNQAITYARIKHDGHLTILRFTTGWKAAYGTPDLDTNVGRKQVEQLKSFPSLEEVLEHLIETKASF